ncbi:MAG: hypothetical protein AAFY65_10280 [Pseudomonadota bacterium]
MTPHLRTLLILPLLTLALAACNVGANDQVDTLGEVEATLDTAIVGSTVPSSTGEAQP